MKWLTWIMLFSLAPAWFAFGVVEINEILRQLRADKTRRRK